MNIKQAMKACIENAYLERAKNTARCYQNAVNRFTEHLDNEQISADDPVAKINADHFITYPSYLLRSGYSKTTVGVYISGAKYLLDWLVINDYLTPTYQETVRLEKALKSAMKKRKSTMPRMPRRGAAEQMIDAVHQMDEPEPRRARNIAIVEMMASTGCRVGEIAGLAIKDVDLSERSAIVTGKGSKQRKVFFDQSTADALVRYWNERGYRDKSHPVFARHDKGAGKRIEPLTTSSYRNIVDHVAMLAGIDKGTFTPHYFRHAYAIKMLRETHNLALVQDLMGHASPNATRVYAKIYPDELREAYREVFD